MAPQPADLAELSKLLKVRANGKRLLVAIAGAPGSGKSTIAGQLARRLNDGVPGTATVLPMDGFHYDDGLLDALGRRARKGAPDTFDVAGLRHLLGRLRANAEDAIAVPVFLIGSKVTFDPPTITPTL